MLARPVPLPSASVPKVTALFSPTFLSATAPTPVSVRASPFSSPLRVKML